LGVCGGAPVALTPLAERPLIRWGFGTGGKGVNNQPGAGNPLDERYYVRGEREAYGPYDGRTLKDMLEQGKVAPDAGIARVGATEWTTIKEHPFFSSIHPAGAVAAAQPRRLPGGPGSGPEYHGETLSGEVEYAGSWFVIGIIAGIAGVLRTGSGNEGLAVLVGLIGILVTLAAAIFYHVKFTSGPWQATPGKRIVRIHVVKDNGERVGGWLAFGRYLCYILSALPLYIGFFVIGWNKEKKGFHDMICGTRVIFGRL
jgi:uncharacterized RDD family membrane protein YckC